MAIGGSQRRHEDRVETGQWVALSNPFIQECHPRGADRKRGTLRGGWGGYEAGTMGGRGPAHHPGCLPEFLLEFLEKVLEFPKVLYDPRSCCSLTGFRSAALPLIWGRIASGWLFGETPFPRPV